MSDHKDPNGTLYQIRVKGNLDPKWADWFEGFVLVSLGDGDTLLSGRVADQAALHGLLGKINSLGLPLVLVTRVDYPYAGNRCPMCNQYLGVKEKFHKTST